MGTSLFKRLDGIINGILFLMLLFFSFIGWRKTSFLLWLSHTHFIKLISLFCFSSHRVVGLLFALFSYICHVVHLVLCDWSFFLFGVHGFWSSSVWSSICFCFCFFLSSAVPFFVCPIAACSLCLKFETLSSVDLIQDLLYGTFCWSRLKFFVVAISVFWLMVKSWIQIAE